MTLAEVKGSCSQAESLLMPFHDLVWVVVHDIKPVIHLNQQVTQYLLLKAQVQSKCVVDINKINVNFIEAENAPRMSLHFNYSVYL